MSQKLSERDQKIVRRFGEILLRGTRAFVAAVRAPSRQENEMAEERFFKALEDLAEEIQSFRE